MPFQNLPIAAALKEIADRLEIQDANPFRVRAHRNAARTVGEFQRDLMSMLEGFEALPRLPGIGAVLAGKIGELALTGHCALLDHLRTAMPASITELLKVPGLGPRRARALWHDLGVQTPAQLLRAARDLKINEYGVFRCAKPIAGATEEAVYAAVGLPYISPELGAVRGEIEAIRHGRLPELIAFGDLKGDLHVHTDATDGRNSLGEMAEAARAPRSTASTPRCAASGCCAASRSTSSTIVRSTCRTRPWHPSTSSSQPCAAAST